MALNFSGRPGICVDVTAEGGGQSPATTSTTWWPGPAAQGVTPGACQKRIQSTLMVCGRLPSPLSFLSS